MPYSLFHIPKTMIRRSIYSPNRKFKWEEYDELFHVFDLIANFCNILHQNLQYFGNYKNSIKRCNRGFACIFIPRKFPCLLHSIVF